MKRRNSSQLRKKIRPPQIWDFRSIRDFPTEEGGEITEIWRRRNVASPVSSHCTEAAARNLFVHPCCLSKKYTLYECISKDIVRYRETFIYILCTPRDSMGPVYLPTFGSFLNEVNIPYIECFIFKKKCIYIYISNFTCKHLNFGKQNMGSQN